MMDAAASPTPSRDESATALAPTASRDEPNVPEIRPVGGPVWVAWREGTLTRANELEAETSRWAMLTHAKSVVPDSRNRAGPALTCGQGQSLAARLGTPHERRAAPGPCQDLRRRLTSYRADSGDRPETG